MSSSLPWVKFHTKVLSSPKWRGLSAVDRCVFLHLVALAGANGSQGTIEGSDSEIADAIALDVTDLRRAVTRLSRVPHESVARTATGLVIEKWAEYQPPARGLSHPQRGERATHPVVLGVVRVDKRREDQTRERVAQLESLEKLPGWKADLARDIEMLEELEAKYPTVDIAWSVRGLQDWLEDGGKTGNLRNSVRQRIAKSFEFGRDLKSSSQREETADEIRARFEAVGL